MILTVAVLLLASCCGSFAFSPVVKQSCDATYKNINETITITSPGGSVPYTGNQTCVYTIHNDKPVKMFLHLKALSLRTADTLTVFNGTVSNDTAIIANFSGTEDTDNNHILMYSISQTLTIVFVAHAGDFPLIDPAAGFQLDVKPNTCEFSFSGQSSSAVNTPKFVVSSGSFQCTYKITTPDEMDHLGLSFDKVNITKGQVTVNGVTYTDGMTDIPDAIVETNMITIDFTLSTMEVQDGFRAAYTTLNRECSSVHNLNKTILFLLNSPGWPAKNYTNNLNCRWLIQSLPGTKLWFQLVDFDLADQYDSVVINDGDSRASRSMVVLNTDYQPKPSLVTSGNSMWIQFTTDEAQTASGFRIVVRQVAYGGTYLNQGDFSVVNQSVVLPESAYDDNIYIQLVAETDFQVMVNFTAVLMPASAIECYDGLSKNDPQIAHLSSDEPFYPVFTKGHVMLIVVKGFLINGTYFTNQSLHGSFQSIVPSDRRKTSIEGSDTFKVMNYDVFNGDATWLVHKPQSGQLSLKMWDLEILPGYTMSIYQGLSDQSVKIAHFTSTPAQSPVFYMDSDVRLTYSKVASAPIENGTETVLSASSTAVTDCNRALITSTGVITSPLYPDMYPLNAHCGAQIAVPPNMTVHIIFSSFQLAPKHHVSLMSQANNKTSDIAHLDHTAVPSDIIASGDTIMIDFSSQRDDMYDFNVAKGFSLQYELMSCGGNITDTSTKVTTPGYPKLVGPNTTCVWIVTLPKPAKNSSVNILNFVFEITGYKGGNHTNTLEIKDGGMNSSEGMDVVLKNGQSNMTLSRYNQLWIKYTFMSGNKNDTGFAFRLNFTALECNKSSQCGNGICIHPNWHCNGIDECGDMTDEQNCTAQHTVIKHTGIQPYVLGLSIILTFFIAVVITLLVPVLLRKMRSRRYDDMTEILSPVET